MAAPAAARFADVCEDDINFILENRDAKNTKLVVKYQGWLINIMQGTWFSQKN